MAELKEIDDATTWAHRILGAKNSLTEADARQVEDAFRAKLAALESAAGTSVANISDQPVSHAVSALEPSSSSLERQPAAPAPATADGIDKSLLAHPEPRRFRDKEHVSFVAKQPCLICGRRPADAHHLRFTQHRALGRKVSDEFAVPLCRGHHREAHRCGDEAAWWKNAGIDPTFSARALWLETHPLPRIRDKMGIDAPTTLAGVGADQINAKRDRLIEKRGPNSKTKPIIAAGPQ